MIKQLFAIMVVAASATAAAQDVSIKSETFGSGTPGNGGFENASQVFENDIYHAPQYMAAFPTAATIWPRVVDVSCIRIGSSVVASVNKSGEVVSATVEPKLKCEGYNWTPKMGRGEYLFFRPHLVEPVQPTIEVRETTIIKEVPAKKVRQ